MKFLIWLGWLTLGALITVSLRTFAGIQLGGIPTAILYALIIVAATKCCKAYDRRRKTPEELAEEEREKKRRKEREQAIVAEGVSAKFWVYTGIICLVALVVVVVLVMCLA